MTQANVVVGIDVGGVRKGFHAVALCDGAYLDQCSATDARVIAAWCGSVGARAVGVDAPCRWSETGAMRPAERALAQAGISCFATPTLERARAIPFHAWMLNGALLYEALLPDYAPLTMGLLASGGRFCVETFPQAVACALAGKMVSAKHKATVRRELLREAGVQTQLLKNIDLVDAAMCAVAARAVLRGAYRKFGDEASGYIVVPVVPARGDAQP